MLCSISRLKKKLFDRVDRILIETKAVEIYGLIDLLDELGFQLAVIPKEQQAEDTDDDYKMEVG